MNEEELIAYHEAGHAFMALRLGGRVSHITIQPDWDEGPDRYGDAEILWHPSEFTPQEFAKRQVLVALAGPAAEMVYRGEPLHPAFIAEWANDWQQAWKAATELIPDERRRVQYLEQAASLLFTTFNDDRCWSAIAAIVDALLAHERLEAEEVADIVEQWLD